MFKLVLLLAAAQISEERRLFLDWGGLTRYGSDNTELRKAPEVVFFGDDLTEKWEPFFPGKPYLNRGVERQVAAQMLVRFRQDVISLKPKIVIIQTGANDIASLMGPSPEPTSADHVMNMVELAQLHGIKVVLAGVTPVCDCTGLPQTKRRTFGRLSSWNGWLKEYAAKKGAVYLDLWTPLVEGRFLKREYTVDGFHLSPAGYERLTEAVEKAISAAR